MRLPVSRAVFLLAVIAPGGIALSAGPQEWAIHDMNRPQPAVVGPGAASDQSASPPADAIVLFDGRSLDRWRGSDGGPARWKVEHGYMEVVKGTGNIQTADSFGDCQLHVEWATPSPGHGEGQERGNSGVFLMGIYELQVLDSFGNVTYPDGQAAALYGQQPPLVNASRPPGQWQTYDIVFRAPRFASDGALLESARITVLHNGVLVHDARAFAGPSAHQARPPYKAHPARLPLTLQDHNDPVRFRNIWIRNLAG